MSETYLIELVPISRGSRTYKVSTLERDDVFIESDHLEVREDGTLVFTVAGDNRHDVKAVIPSTYYVACELVQCRKGRWVDE